MILEAKQIFTKVFNFHECTLACLHALSHCCHPLLVFLVQMMDFYKIDCVFLIENEFKLTYKLESFVAYQQQLNIVGLEQADSKNANKPKTSQDMIEPRMQKSWWKILPSHYIDLFAMSYSDNTNLSINNNIDPPLKIYILIISILSLFC